MGLKYITGRAGSGKTALCLKSIIDAENNCSQTPIFYIVPEQYTLQGERDLISYSKNGAVMKAQVLSFNRLCYNIFSRSGGLCQTPLDDIGKALVIKKIVAENKNDFLYFKNCCSKPGFIEQLCDIITEFFKFGVTQKDIEEMIISFDEEALESKLKDLHIIYSKFSDYIKSGYISSDTALDMLYEKIDSSGFVKDALVWIDGFSSFTPQELKIIEKLLMLCQNVTVTLTLGKAALNNDNLSPISVFYEPKEAFNKILKTAQKHNIKAEVTYIDKIYRFTNPALVHLEKSLLTYTPSQFKNSKGIYIYEAQDRFDEAENVACRILSLIKDKKLRFSDIAVITGDMENSVSMLKNVFYQNNIPFFADIKRDITIFPLIRLISALFDCVLMSMSYESVFSMLKTGLLPFTGDEIETLENYVLCHGIKGYKWQSQWQYSDIHSTQSDFNDNINLLRQRVLDLIDIFLSSFEKGESTVKSISTALYNFLEMTGAIEKLQNYSDEFEKSGDFTKSYETHQSFNALSAILDSMCSITGDEKCSLAQYKEMFLSAAEVKKVGIIPPETDSVIIGDTERTRLPEIKALFIINANEGVFPKNAAKQSVFSDNERSFMLSKGLNIASDSKEAAFLQQYSAYFALTRPKDELYVSYIKTDSSGKSIALSSVIERIKKALPDIEVSSSGDISSRTLSLNSPYSIMHSMGKELQSGSKEYKEIYNALNQIPLWQPKTNIINKAISNSGPREYLSKETSEKFFSNTLFSSISRLERFSSCPYMYFMSYTIKATERPVYKLNTPDLGILFHSVIENFSKTLQKDGITWDNVTQDDIYKIIADSVKTGLSSFNNGILVSSYTMKYLMSRFSRVSSRAVNTLINHVKKGSFAPFAFEVNFGSGGLAPIVIDLGNGRRMFLTGKIDRVDIMESDGKLYIKIIDYKSGSKSFSLQDIYYGLQLQLMIYIDAIIKSGIFRDKTPLPGGVFYFKIQDPVAKTTEELSFDDIKELIEKQLKMSGLVLMDENVIRAMDNSFEKKSDIIPVSYKADGSISQSSYTASKKDFLSIMDYCRHKATSIGNEILKGNIAPEPYVKGQTMPCSYCAYKSVCDFDRENSRGRFLKTLNKDEALEKINNEINPEKTDI